MRGILAVLVHRNSKKAVLLSFATYLAVAVASAPFRPAVAAVSVHNSGAPSALRATRLLPKGTLIVSIGDSITSGYKATIAYPELLGLLLRVQVVNLGVGGLTAVRASRFQMPKLSRRCSIATIYLGGNDAASIQFRKTETLLEYADAMRTIVAKTKAQCGRVYVATMPDYGQPLLMRGMNSVIRGLGIAVVNLNADARMDDARNYSDGVHPNDAGQRAIAEDFAAAILPKPTSLGLWTSHTSGYTYKALVWNGRGARSPRLLSKHLLGRWLTSLGVE